MRLEKELERGNEITDRELYEYIDVEDMLREMGVRNVRDTYGGEVQFSCPFPGHSSHDASPSASMSTVEREIPHSPSDTYPKTSFYCFGCGMKGTAITFVSEYEGVSPITAKRFLRERFANDYRDSGGSIEEAVKAILEKKDKKIAQSPNPTIPESILDDFWVNWPELFMAWEATQGTGVEEYLGYMLNRGFLPETLMDFDIGFDYISKRISIPTRNHVGELIGFKARAWWSDATPRYKVLGGEEYSFQPYSVSHVLWGLHIAKYNSIDKPLIVREGELNAMKLQEMGFKNAVGISGKRISPFQIDLIKTYSDAVVFWMDDLQDALIAADQLNNTMSCKVVPETGFDPVDAGIGDCEAAIDAAESYLTLRIRSMC